jgi:hypothetical protein
MWKLVLAAILAAAVILQSGTEAEARGHRHHHRGGVTGMMGGRPARWCGWWMRQQVGGDPGPDYNLARNWAHWGRSAGGPGIGVVVVWAHHVGRIVDRTSQGWVVQSGNDGHRVRSRVRSLAGVIAYRER